MNDFIQSRFLRYNHPMNALSLLSILWSMGFYNIGFNAFIYFYFFSYWDSPRKAQRYIALLGFIGFFGILGFIRY
jgi:hypothetical protein